LFDAAQCCALKAKAAGSSGLRSAAPEDDSIFEDRAQAVALDARRDAAQDRAMGVALRPLRDDDGARVRAWRNAPHVAEHMYTDHAISEAEHAAWLEAALTREDRRYWIVLDNERPVGLANLARIDRANRRCDWAYYLGQTDTRGRGVGACVEYLVLNGVFGPMGLNKLACEVFVANEAVWRLHESFGFVREAHYRDHVWKAGRFHDVYGLAILAADWAARRDAVATRLVARGHDPRALEMRDA
jgi:UDP-4-amino-4,6-dideoxy-N-acetyl-beta-L-altrosamine N-acetyltransferase